jgi:transcriptional regulator with XRE-family HTH domain
MAKHDSGWWFLKTMVRKGRNEAGLSQRELGDEVDRSKETIHAWENGKTDISAHSIANIAKACGLSEEISDYMKAVARARKNGATIEATARLNALFVALAEEYYGVVFKWDPHLVPGPLQTERFHFIVVPKTEPTASESRLLSGWKFKCERCKAIRSRIDNPIFQFLIGEAAMIQLRRESEELYQEQLAYLREWAEHPGVEIRILTEPVRSGEGMFSIYEPGKSKLAGPPFVYTEGHDSSWCIDDPDRIARYDDFRKTKWKLAIRIEDYGDDYRCDRMA